MKIELRSPLPVYKQIKIKVKEAVLQGRISLDDTIPSIRELARDINVNPNTVARAYRELEKEKIIFSRPGVGYMINMSRDQIKERFLKELENELTRPVKRFKKAGISKDEVLGVIEKLWNGSGGEGSGSGGQVP